MLSVYPGSAGIPSLGIMNVLDQDFRYSPIEMPEIEVYV